MESTCQGGYRPVPAAEAADASATKKADALAAGPRKQQDNATRACTTRDGAERRRLHRFGRGDRAKTSAMYEASEIPAGPGRLERLPAPHEDEINGPSVSITSSRAKAGGNRQWRLHPPAVCDQARVMTEFPLAAKIETPDTTRTPGDFPRIREPPRSSMARRRPSSIVQPIHPGGADGLSPMVRRRVVRGLPEKRRAQATTVRAATACWT